MSNYSKIQPCPKCGKVREMTKHHIVPMLYFKQPEVRAFLKDIGYCDRMCRECHDVYEVDSKRLRMELAQRFTAGVPWDCAEHARKLVAAIGAMKIVAIWRRHHRNPVAPLSDLLYD